MKLDHIVFEELKQRKVRLITSILVIFLATSVIVSVQSISNSSRKAITQQLHNIGPNTFVLPKSLPLAEYYAMNFSGSGMPESYYYKLTGSGLAKEKHIFARLYSKIDIGGHQAILTGVLPFHQEQDEQEKGQHDLLLGNRIARLLGKKTEEQLIISDEIFNIAAVLPEKGTIDDIKIFAPLHTVQQLLKRGRVVSTIEVISEETEGLADRIEILLPDTRVVTKNKIARVKENTIRALKRYSLLLLLVVLLVGGISIANFMSINVRERRREIGTLIAMGATPGIILSIFLKKAVLLGVIGGFGGCMFGTFLAVYLGPKIVKIPVWPEWPWYIWSILIAVVFSVVSSYFPARKAASLDPAAILQEE